MVIACTPASELGNTNNEVITLPVNPSTLTVAAGHVWLVLSVMEVMLVPLS